MNLSTMDKLMLARTFKDDPETLEILVDLELWEVRAEACRAALNRRWLARLDAELKEAEDRS